MQPLKFQTLAAIESGDTGAGTLAGRRMGRWEKPTMTPISTNSTYIFIVCPYERKPRLLERFALETPVLWALLLLACGPGLSCVIADYLEFGAVTGP